MSRSIAFILPFIACMNCAAFCTGGCPAVAAANRPAIVIIVFMMRKLPDSADTSREMALRVTFLQMALIPSRYYETRSEEP